MTISTMDNFTEDDVNYILYRDVPEGYRFTNITPKPDCPLSIASWTLLTAFADKYYASREIVGETVQDFFDELYLSYMLNADTLERLLEVYYDDIAKPILGRSEVVTYDVTDNTSGTSASTGENIDTPIVGETDDTPSSKTKGDNVSSGNSSRTGTMTTELSDLGVRPNYESLNGFLDANRTFYKVFVDFFKKDFTLAGGLKW